MGIPVLIIGKSGTGKSRSLKTFKPEEIGVIKAIEKELPFRNDFKTITTNDYGTINSVLLKSKTNSIVVDDAGYLLTGEFMRRAKEVGYNKFTEIANHFYDLITFITTQLPREKIVYLIMHEDENEVTGECKPKTVGKLLDEKIVLEGMFTIVLRCLNEDGKHIFKTNNSGCAKSPEEMFDETIENDLKFVDTSIREYYNLGGGKQDETSK